MRTVVSAVFALVALLLAAAALGAAWVDANLVDEDGFVAIAAPLGQDATFQEELSAALAEDLSGSTSLPEPIAALVGPVISDAASAIAQAPGYPAAWEESLRISHALTLAGQDAGQPAAGEPLFQLDLRPLATLMADQVSAGINVDVPVPEDTVIDMGSRPANGAFAWITHAAALWPMFGAASAVAGLLALLAARRRATTLMLLGAGTAVVGLIGWYAAGLVPGIAAKAAGGNAVARVFAEGFAARAAVEISDSSVPVLIGGAALAALALVVKVLFRRDRSYR